MNSVYIEEISIENYRSCTGTVFRPNSSLSGLIGINGSGKTNILNALRLLNPELYERSNRSAKEDSSLPKSIFMATFRINSKRVLFKLTLTIASSSGSEEVISSLEQWNFVDFTKDDYWIDIPSYLANDTYRNKYAINTIYNSNRRKGTQGNNESDIHAQAMAAIFSNNEFLTVFKSIVAYRTQIRYYSASIFTDPSRCPSSFEIDATGDLDRPYYGRPPPAHLQFLYDLYSLKKINPTLYQEYEYFVSTKTLGLVSRISWKPVKLSSQVVELRSGGSINKVRQYKTLVVPKVQVGSSHITFNQLSEGTFKTLALIFYIMTDKSSCLLIEEPEVCIHHGLLRRIISTIKAYSRDRQIIFTTHSDLAIDLIDPDNIFVVDMKRSSTRVGSLSHWAGENGMLALNAYLEESGTLGEYWRSGGFTS